MSEPVSKHDAEHMQHEYKKTISTLLATLLARIKNSGTDVDNQVTIKVDKENVYRSVGHKELENRLTPEQVKQIQIALESPQRLQGSVSISIGKEKIFHVKDGKVITDSLQLISEQPQLKEQGQELNLTLQEAKGKNLVKYAKELVSRLVKQKEADESLRLESKKYIFTQKGESLSVTAKDGRREVLNNNGFTKLATSDDMTSLYEVKDFVQKLKLESPVVKPVYKAPHL